jgi:4-diphosphocytidyl-2-C-methyl-D-erythritol kinase
MLHIHAPAKVNLGLHITGKRADGYHLLHSLVMFAQDISDSLRFTDAASCSDIELDISGEFAGALVQECPDITKNLVWRAAQLLRDRCGVVDGVKIHLKKNLPSQAGLGGGSSDAAATLHGLNQFWQLGLSMQQLAEMGRELGADVPMCVYAKALIAQGIGEDILLVDSLPALPVLLVKPVGAVSTIEVFRRLEYCGDTSVCLTAERIERAGVSVGAWVELLREMRNDLMSPAMSIAPVIADVLGVIFQQQGCRLARMSGSGNACFGIFDSMDDAQEAKIIMKRIYPQWWIAAGTLS